MGDIGRTGQGYPIGRRLCCNVGRCRVSLACVFSRVWRGTCQRPRCQPSQKAKSIIPFEMFQALEEATASGDGAGV